MAHYIVGIDKIQRTDDAPDGINGRLRFDISCCTPAPDSNNNVKQYCCKNVACFEILEEEVKCIKVFPFVGDAFTVELIKGFEVDASKTASVEIIHKRHGVLTADSHDNVITTSPKNQPHTPTPIQAIPKLTTFDGICCHSSSRAASVVVPDSDYEEESSNSPPCIMEDDIQAYSRFTFKLHPLTDTTSPPQDKSNDLNGNKNETPDQPIEQENQLIDEAGAADLIKTVQFIPEEASPALNPQQNIAFQSTFDNAVTIIIEMFNLLLVKKELRPIQGLQNLREETVSDKNYNSIRFGSASPTSQMTSRLKNLKEIAQIQLQHERFFSSQQTERSPLPSSRISVVHRFVKDMVIQRLLSLGVQQLDCNEIMDAWVAKQYQNTFHFFPYPEDEQLMALAVKDVLSPNISKPNSSLFRLTPSSLIPRSIFSRFPRQVEIIKGIICNATCTLIHSSVYLLLPEIKLLKSRQLETNSNPHFIHEWIRLILLTAEELNPAGPQDVAKMVNRELKTLKVLSRDLYLSAKKLNRKLTKLCDYSQEIFHKTLSRLHPKSLAKLNACTGNIKSHESPNVIHFDADLLRKIPIEPEDLLKDHVFLSETKTGELLLKTDIDNVWKLFLEWDFSNKRTVFLALVEDLQQSLRSTLYSVKHLQEMYMEGYPTSIKKLLGDVVDELYSTSKREDLTVLIKTSVVTHASCLHELMTRLKYVSLEMYVTAKNFHRSLQSIAFNPAKVYKRNTEKFMRKGEEIIETRARIGLPGYDSEIKAGIENSNAQLVTPLRHADFHRIFGSEDDS